MVFLNPYRSIKLFWRRIMKKIVPFVIVGLIALVGVGCGTSAQQAPAKGDVENLPAVTATDELPKPTEYPGYQNATFEVEGVPVSLVNGVSEIEAAPGSANKIVTKYFGNEAFEDLNGDGKEDVAFLITQNGGGSGTFYYIVAAVQTETGYQGTTAVLLGDRIAPQTTQIEDGQIVVNYAIQKRDDPLTAQPSIGVSKRIKVLDGKLVERLIVSPFETVPNSAVPAKDIVISQNIDEITNLTEWTVKSPSWLPDGYKFNEAMYDSANKMVILTFIVTRQLQENDPSLTQTNTITLVQSLRNDLIPLVVAPGTDIENITINDQPAAYAVGAWKNDNTTGTATWDRSIQQQNINWQIDFTYLSANTDDTLVSKDDLLKMAESTK